MRKILLTLWALALLAGAAVAADSIAPSSFVHCTNCNTSGKDDVFPSGYFHATNIVTRLANQTMMAFSGQRNPLATDDTTSGFTTSSLWNGPGGLFTPAQVTAGAATWTPIPSPTLPCDVGDTANLSICAGTRLLKAGYAGSALTVVRASDSTTKNISFLANGKLDEATMWQFCAGTTCQVSKWFDQSGNQQAVSATVQAGGSGYVTGTVTVSGGTCLIQPTFTFTASAGAITAPLQAKAGICSVVPANPVSLTGGSGSGGTLNVTWANLDLVQATAANRPFVNPWNRVGTEPSMVFNSILDSSPVSIDMTFPTGTTQAVLGAANAAGIFLFGDAAVQDKAINFVNLTVTGGVLRMENQVATANCPTPNSGSCMDFTVSGFSPAHVTQYKNFPAVPSLLGMSVGSSSMTSYLGEMAPTTTSGTAVSGAMTAGNLGLDGGSAGQMDLGAVIIYNDATSAANVTLLRQSLHQTFGTHPQVLDVIAFDGDSIGQGYNGTATTAFNNETPIALVSKLLLPYEAIYYNYAVFGNTQATRVTNYPLATANSFNSAARNNIMITEAGTNDLNAGTSAATTYASTASLVALAHTTGFKVVCRTIIARNDAHDTDRLAYNVLMRANTAGCDAISDAGNDAIMGSHANVGNTAYFVDGTHPTNLGYQIIAQYDTAAIQSLIQ